MVVHRRDSRQRSVLLGAIVISLVLITIDSRGSGLTTSVRSVARDVLAPVQNVVDDAFTPVRDLFGGITDYGALKAENARLKRDLATAKGKLTRVRGVGSEVSQLEKLLDLPTIEDATGIAARVISGAPGNFQRSVEINKGTSSGVDVGQPVVAGDGLVGKVTDVSGSTATVTLIDSPSFGIGVRLENSQDRGIAQGSTGERTLRLTTLTNIRAQVKKGELVFTAAVASAAFPPDIPVARVLSVSRPRGDLEPTIVLQPLVNLNDLNFIKTLRWPPPKGK